MAVGRVTIIQFSRDSDDPAKNLERMQADVRAHRQSDLVIFPELALHGHKVAEGPPSEMREALRGVTEDQLRDFDETVAECNTRVIYGKLLQRAGQLHNLATFTDGRTRVSYAKTHVHWSERFEPGTEFPVVRDFMVPLGMLICFDAAFPEVPRILALRGAEVIVNISAIPEVFSIEHVHRRLVACSVQNQVYTIFANRAGEGFRGGSAVVGPRGDMIAVAGETGPLTVDLDFDEIGRWRQEEPTYAYRRPHLYTDIAR